LCATCSMICHIGKFKFFFVDGLQEWRAASAIGQVQQKAIHVVHLVLDEHDVALDAALQLDLVLDGRR
jgi:hypothetical protein